MPNDIAATFRTEGQLAFPVSTENDNSAGSPPEQTPSEQTPSSEENKAPEGTEPEGTEPKGEQTLNKETADDAGLAKHPRWKEREGDWKERFNQQEERHTNEIAKLREEMQGLSKPSHKAEPVGEIPAWFGGDEDQWGEFQSWNKTLVEQARDESLKEINSKSDAENKAIAEATQYFKDQVLEIEGEGSKVDRNKLLKFTIDNDLVDSKGRWNYSAAHRMMQAGIANTTTDKLNKRKNIASATTSEKKSETKPSDTMSSQDFKNPSNRPW